jgi:hypothetical protein
MILKIQFENEINKLPHQIPFRRTGGFCLIFFQVDNNYCNAIR